ESCTAKRASIDCEVSADELQIRDVVDGARAAAAAADLQRSGIDVQIRCAGYDDNRRIDPRRAGGALRHRAVRLDADLRARSGRRDSESAGILDRHRAEDQIDRAAAR